MLQQMPNISPNKVLSKKCLRREKRREEKSASFVSLVIFQLLYYHITGMPRSRLPVWEHQSSSGVGSCGSAATSSAATGPDVSGVVSGSGGGRWLRMTCTT